ncbi:hypothetical protein [Fervidibacter sacchari]
MARWLDKAMHLRITNYALHFTQPPSQPHGFVVQRDRSVMKMRPEFDRAFADCTKALDGWFGMVRALRISLCEEMESGGFLSALFHAVCGYALLLLVLAFLLSALFGTAFNWAWDLVERIIPAPVSQQQISNEVSPQA